MFMNCLRHELRRLALKVAIQIMERDAREIMKQRFNL
jgi:hypothetical protein